MLESGLKVNRPNKCQVGALTVPIRWNKRLKDFGKFKDSPQPTITIRGGMESALTAETFLHELIHLLWWTANIDMNLGEELSANITEEAIVSRLSPALTNFWHQNPHIHDWWTSLIR